METEVKLTKLANCAGCGAKMGAGTLAKMLEGFKAHFDPRLIVGYDKSDDASVYVLDDTIERAMEGSSRHLVVSFMSEMRVCAGNPLKRAICPRSVRNELA